MFIQNTHCRTTCSNPDGFYEHADCWHSMSTGVIISSSLNEAATNRHNQTKHSNKVIACNATAKHRSCIYLSDGYGNRCICDGYDCSNLQLQMHMMVKSCSSCKNFGWAAVEQQGAGRGSRCDDSTLRSQLSTVTASQRTAVLRPVRERAAWRPDGSEYRGMGFWRTEDRHTFVQTVLLV